MHSRAFLQPETASVITPRAMAMTHTDGDPSAYIVKYRGAPVLDEQRTLAEAGVVSNAPLIVMARRRRPVR